MNNPDFFQLRLFQRRSYQLDPNGITVVAKTSSDRSATFRFVGVFGTPAPRPLENIVTWSNRALHRMPSAWLVTAMPTSRVVGRDMVLEPTSVQLDLSADRYPVKVPPVLASFSH